jgi:hypothetical protein
VEPAHQTTKEYEVLLMLWRRCEVNVTKWRTGIPMIV